LFSNLIHTATKKAIELSVLFGQIVVFVDVVLPFVSSISCGFYGWHYVVVCKTKDLRLFTFKLPDSRDSTAVYKLLTQYSHSSLICMYY